jgi:hypothetical protein
VDASAREWVDALFEVHGRGPISFPAAPETRPRMTFNASTGMISGQFELEDPNPEGAGRPLRRVVRFLVVVVPGSTPQGGGFFNLPQLANPPLTTGRTSPILSGAMVVD